MKELSKKILVQKKKYTLSKLEGNFIRMATGLLTKEVFNIAVTHSIRFKASINYFVGWKVESITFQDQIFIILWKCDRTIRTSISLYCGHYFNFIITFIHVLRGILAS